MKKGEARELRKGPQSLMEQRQKRRALARIEKPQQNSKETALALNGPSPSWAARLLAFWCLQRDGVAHRPLFASCLVASVPSSH